MSAIRGYAAVGLVEDALRAAFGPGWLIRSQGPIALDEESEPEPDIAVAPGGRRDYSREHPARPVLVVEVAVSSLSLDRDHTGSLYARARLDDYWILNIVDRVLDVYRQPAVDVSAPFGWSYGRRWEPIRSSRRSRRRTPPSPSPRSCRSRPLTRQAWDVPAGTRGVLDEGLPLSAGPADRPRRARSTRCRRRRPSQPSLRPPRRARAAPSR